MIEDFLLVLCPIFNSTVSYYTIAHSSANIPSTTAPTVPICSAAFVPGAAALIVGTVPNVDVVKTMVVLGGGIESVVPLEVIVVGTVLVVVVDEEGADEGVDDEVADVADVMEMGGPRVVIGGEGVGGVLLVVVLVLEEVDDDVVVTELHMLVNTPVAELWSSFVHTFAEHCKVAFVKLFVLQRHGASVREHPTAVAAVLAQSLAQGGRLAVS